jgi:hypothetical protein
MGTRRWLDDVVAHRQFVRFWQHLADISAVAADARYGGGEADIAVVGFNVWFCPIAD